MARVIMIASGKGGTGKSTVATFLSHELGFKGKKTFLTELDMGFRSIDVISGISEMAVYDIGDVLDSSCAVQKAMVVSPRTKNLHIMAAPGRKSGVKLENLKGFIDSIYNDYDYIILDTAAGVGEAFNAALAVANMAVVVATPDAISVRDARIVSDEIYYSGIKDVRLIINKYNKETFKHSGFEDGDSIIDACCAQLLGVVPNDEQLHLAAMTGKPLVSTDISKKVFSSIAERIEGNHTQIVVK
ncbi:MAG: septum site-determining protein MinD [Ruminococcaceae bacterium]|nr:septum site-determining protein MinD [Oscillospiraceae bacterium]